MAIRKIDFQLGVGGEGVGEALYSPTDAAAGIVRGEATGDESVVDGEVVNCFGGPCVLVECVTHIISTLLDHGQATFWALNLFGTMALWTQSETTQTRADLHHEAEATCTVHSTDNPTVLQQHRTDQVAAYSPRICTCEQKKTVDGWAP